MNNFTLFFSSSIWLFVSFVLFENPSQLILAHGDLAIWGERDHLNKSFSFRTRATFLHNSELTTCYDIHYARRITWFTSTLPTIFKVHDVMCHIFSREYGRARPRFSFVFVASLAVPILKFSKAIWHGRVSDTL